jgi:hypothetical protein
MQNLMKFGAYWFNGQNNIQITTKALSTPAATWSAWIHRQDNPLSQEYVLAYGTYSTSRFLVNVNDGNLLIHDDILNEGQSATLATNAFPTGEWHHLVIVFEPNGRKLAYVDGEFVGSYNGLGNLAQISSDVPPKFHIGSQLAINMMCMFLTKH